MTLDYRSLIDMLHRAESQSSRFDLLAVPPGSLDTLSRNPIAGNLISAGAPLFGMRVVESVDAKMPARVHKRRRGMSEAYHRRVQKKWTKRYGYVPCAFLMNTRALLGLTLPTPRIDWSGIAVLRGNSIIDPAALAS